MDLKNPKVTEKGMPRISRKLGVLRLTVQLQKVVTGCSQRLDLTIVTAKTQWFMRLVQNTDRPN